MHVCYYGSITMVTTPYTWTSLALPLCIYGLELRKSVDLGIYNIRTCAQNTLSHLSIALFHECIISLASTQYDSTKASIYNV